MTDQVLTDVWEKWCLEAATNAGITVDKLKALLEAGDGYLDIRATVTLQGGDETK